jgi:ligand-binding SRPBCC domain-containing protein
MTIEFSSYSGVFSLKATQNVPLSLSDTWNFFSHPENLAKITPPEMNFNITSGTPKDVYAGQMISYKVSVLKSIRMSWVTEITHVKHENYFVDEQRFGPYSMWHHEHFFERIDDHNCKISDKITYKIPFGFIGLLAHKLFIKAQLKTIFEYRHSQIKKMFKTS